MFKYLKRSLLALAFVLFSLPTLAQQKLTVFAAASMTNVLQDIAAEYKKQQADSDIVFSFASSSVLARQIDEGAPADIFISANLNISNLTFYSINVQLISLNLKSSQLQ